MFHNESFQKIAEVNEISVIMPHILNHFGINNRKQILECLPNDENHISLNIFRVALAKLGIGTTVENKSSKNLKPTNSNMPWLIISPDAPMLFVTQKKDNFFTYYDSMTGKKCSKEALPISEKFQLIMFHSISQQGLIDDSNAWHQRLFDRYKSSFLSLFIASTVFSLMSLAIPITIMLLYDLIIPAKSMGLLQSVAIGLGILSLSSFFIDVFRSKVVTFLNLRVNTTINEIIINKLISLPAKMTENASIASQILKLKDLSLVHNIFITPWFLSIFELPSFLLIITTMAIIGKTIILFPIIAAILHVALYYFIKQYSIISGRKSFLLNDKHLYNTAETFTHLETIKYNGKEENWKARYNKSNHAFCENSYQTAKKFILFDNISSFIVLINIVATTLFGTFKVTNGQLSVGGLLACMILGWMSIIPFKGTLKLLFNLGPFKNHLNQIQKLLKLPSEYHPYYPYPNIDGLHGDIFLKNTSFRYQGDNNTAIKNLNVRIPKNTITCVTGPNGSGKSTLLKLLTRLYEHQIGAISIGGTNIKQYSFIEYQKNIGYLPEKISILPGKISDILGFDNPIATETEIFSACKRANIFKDIHALPEKFDTLIGYGGEEKITEQFLKKLFIARLLIKSPSIYLLDEPTTYLDVKDIKSLIEELVSLRNSATIIIVTHMPELFSCADNILNLNSGEVNFYGPMDKFHNSNVTNRA